MSIVKGEDVDRVSFLFSFFHFLLLFFSSSLSFLFHLSSSSFFSFSFSSSFFVLLFFSFLFFSFLLFFSKTNLSIFPLLPLPPQAFSAATFGAIKGGVIGLAVGLSGGALLQWKSPLVKNLTIPGKVFLLSSCAVAGFWIGGDKALLHYTRDPTVKHVDSTVTGAEQVAVKGPATFLGVEHRTWLKYRYHIVGATWAGSVAGSLAWTLRQKHVRFSQRLVQARVYAQFVTIACLLGTAFLAQLAEVPEDEEGEGAMKKRRY